MGEIMNIAIATASVGESDSPTLAVAVSKLGICPMLCLEFLSS